MPELPEVETICQGLKPVLEGKKIMEVELNRPNLRYPFPAGFSAALKDKKVSRVTRQAKYLMITLSDGVNLVIHLGMSGRLKIMPSHQTYTIEAHDHVIFVLQDGTRVIYYDPRRFGFMDIYKTAEPPSFLQNLGVEPLGNSFHAGYLAQKWRGRSTSIKAALLDQRVIAGLGNIYALEALFRAQISPFVKAGALVGRNGQATSRLEQLVTSIRDVLTEAIQSGGSSLKDYARTDGSLGYFQHHFQVYGREGETCAKEHCDGIIAKEVQNGRSSFYCGKCQK